MKIIKKQWFEKARNAFLGVAVLVFALSFLLVACTCQCEDELPGVNEEEQSATVQRRLESEQLVALAVCRVFDGRGMSLKSSSPNMAKGSYFSIAKSNTDEKSHKIKYAFDFVEINDAVHYIAQGFVFPFLNEICGEGEIDVFLTSFNTYIYADETKDENNLQPQISDELIVFRGEWGMYSCMTNSGSFEYDDMNNLIYSLIGYSSHKRFSENSVEKDFTPPIYHFFVKTENDLTSLACYASNEVGTRPDKSVQWTKLEGGEIISSEELFRTEELYVMSEMLQQCTITGIGGDYFFVIGERNLEKIFFDEYTLFFEGDQPVESTDFVKGDVVTVSFNKPYEKYNPKVAMANQIVK